MGWHSETSDPDAVFASSPNGWTDDKLGLKWIKHFDTHTSSNSRPHLLILDGHRSYLSIQFCHISNNPSFRLKHPGVPDGSDSSDGTSYPLMENYTLPVAQVTGHVAYSPPLLCARYTHHQNDTCVTLFAGAAVML